MPLKIKEFDLSNEDEAGVYNASRFAEKVGVSAAKLREWDNSGFLVAKRTVTGQKYYTKDDVMYVLREFYYLDV